MKEHQPKPFTNEESPQQGRRGFLRGVLAGAAGLYVGNKYLEREKEINAFYLRFKDKERSYEAASQAALLLMNEMDMSNLDHVSLSGTGYPNDRIEVLRTYLAQHLNTKGVGDKYPFQKQIMSSGVFTRENLLMLNATAGYLSQSGAPLGKQDSQNTSRSEI
jgi:hypothetical protein